MTQLRVHIKAEKEKDIPDALAKLNPSGEKLVDDVS